MADKLEPIYRCTNCEAVYLEKVTDCDCQVGQNQEYDEWVMMPKSQCDSLQAQFDAIRAEFIDLAEKAEQSRNSIKTVDERNYLLGVAQAYKDAAARLRQQAKGGTPFSDFIKHGSDEDKERVYSDVLDRANERQAKAGQR